VLTAAGIEHELATFEELHDDKVGERIGEYMLPFFSTIFSEGAESPL